MAELVAGVGAPHTPVFPVMAHRDPGGEVARRFGELAVGLAPVRPDALVIFSSDHLNQFFLDQWPVFAIHAGELVGPVDDVPLVPRRPVRIASSLARWIHRSVCGAGFDPTLTLSSGVDHGVSVPLHFLDRDATMPVVAIHVNGVLGPLPSASRCLAFGRAVGDAVRSFVGDVQRVAVVASGSISLEVGGPRLTPGHMWGVPDPGWAAEVSRLLGAGYDDEVVRLATEDRLAGAGTVAGELLSWIAMRGAADRLPPVFVDHREGEGHAFALWHA